MEGLERLRKPLIYPTDLRGHLISHSLSVGLFASVSVDKLPEPFPQLIVHQRDAYRQRVKVYSRYAPPRVPRTEITEVIGIPDYSKVCTSYVEQQNLTLQMKIARFHRLTLAFSRKLANMKAAVALYFWSDTFCLIHRALRMTTAWRYELLIEYGN